MYFLNIDAIAAAAAEYHDKYIATPEHETEETHKIAMEHTTAIVLAYLNYLDLEIE